ncbi:histidinol phosphate phosphatase [Sporolituus thermophilus]|uniref:Histidinol-phosphatase n=1 Tax=Sporolituus thermophilus DSM 23256 TaxID=1123285 RepID=A0A1G7JYQ9_9FIRM|nr:histidinol phosphate phosphatase [Sporolituus thermophilus]SDF29901.1 histidinol-phosphatase (PHP family) [Sporolituus thermophilus DSM 23256]
MLFDTHMHTKFSTDSRMTINQAMTKAGELGLGITITEHMDLDYPEPQAFIFNPAAYFAEYEKYRSEQVLLGIEIGMRPGLEADNRRIVRDYPFDYVIGSIHVIDNIDIYCAEFYNLRTKAEVYRRYFDAMAECLESYEFIDSLGHIDYIARYARFADPEVYYHEFPELIDRVLAAAARRQLALEINTRRLNREETVKALVPVYQRFYELGGRLVTIGSDAHTPGDIGKGMDVALAIADYCHLRPVWFKDRKIQYVKKN